MFRHPKDTISFNKTFYQNQYKQEGGITTEVVSNAELSDLISNNFALTDKSIVEFVKVLDVLNLNHAGLKLTDYGASWGYMTYQFLQQGYEVDSFEISKSRAALGNNKLNLRIKTSESDLLSDRDVFFSSHVIEHVPIVSSMLDISKKVLNKDGFFIAECPNGSADFKKRNPVAFHKMWGQVHPNVISDKFYKEAFRNCPYIIASTPYDSNKLSQIQKWDQKGQLSLDTSGPEILAIAKVNIKI